MNNEIKIGRKYFMNGTEVEALAYKTENEVLMVRDNEGYLDFIVGDFKTVDDNLVTRNTVGYMVTDKEMLDYINNDISKIKAHSKDDVIKAIRNKYYKIPRKIAEVVAEWYLG